TGSDPVQLLTLVDAITRSFLKEIKTDEETRRDAKVQQLDKLSTESKEKLRTKRESLKTLADSLGNSDPQALSAKQVGMLGYYHDMQRQHTQVGFKLAEAQARVAALKAREKTLDSAEIPEPAVNELLESDLEAKQHQARVTRLQQIVKNFERSAGYSDEPSLVRARRHLADTQKLLDERRNMLRAEF